MLTQWVTTKNGHQCSCEQASSDSVNKQLDIITVFVQNMEVLDSCLHIIVHVLQDLGLLIGLRAGPR